MQGRQSSRAGPLLLWVFLVGCATDGVPQLGQPADASAGVIGETQRLMNLSLDRWLERYVRLQRISQTLRLAGAEVCEGRQSPVLGAAVADMAHFPVALDYTAAARFGTLEGLRVIDVFPEMAAARGGLRRGDMILAVDDRRVDDLTQLNRPLDEGDRLGLQVERDGERLELALHRDAGCGFPAEMFLSEEVNALATGSQILFTSALVREVRDDSLLAMVVGHELAHNILGHSRRRTWGSPPKEEMQADYLGIYLASMANFPLAGDAELYLILIRDINQITQRSRTHPTGPARSIAFRKTLAEIADRRARGQPLRPDR